MAELFAPVVEDPDQAHPVPSAWRGSLVEVVRLLADGDYALNGRRATVAQLRPGAARQIQEAVADYGETLTQLPAASWQTSIAQWMESHWDVLVDLWTVGEGASDLVLHARVFETGDQFRVEISGVWVP